jgi:hypothetical protein
MELVEIELARLEDHPGNSNVMPAAALTKLKAHLAEHGRYPPLTVRRLKDGEDGPRYQLLDGHHRARALRELGRAAARCDVWDVDDDEALVVLATLNRLRGRDDPRRRAALLTELSQRFDRKRLLARLPETPEKLQRLTAMHASGPALRPAPKPADLPVAMHFFFKPAEKRAVEAALRAAMNETATTREAALIWLLERGSGGSGDSRDCGGPAFGERGLRGDGA